MTRSGGTRQGFKEEVVVRDLILYPWATTCLPLTVGTV